MATAIRRRCPICGKPAVEKTRPFCSARCKQIDLGRWLSGRYVIPAADDEDGEIAPTVPRRDDEEF